MLLATFLLRSKHKEMKFSAFSRNLGTKLFNVFVKLSAEITKALGFVGVFFNISRYSRCHREQNAPHKSFCQLVHKIEYFMPVLRDAPRSARRTGAR